LLNHTARRFFQSPHEAYCLTNFRNGGKVMKKLLSRLTRQEEGATMVEYGLLVALIACACIVAVTLVGTDLAAMFNAVAGKIAGATP
jgi:pilus assembly protein Flp/PilA